MVLRGIESSTLALLLAILYFAIGEPFYLFLFGISKFCLELVRGGVLRSLLWLVFSCLV
jgi:hypothetical protein